ncbi:MAG TPA: CinA family protein, partial [Campylobacterales bacterium]|nr:CinA family protein [Campylobacterales bacterium]
TGGRIASVFTAISGASSVLNGSAVTYSNKIKSQWLGVREETLINYGAVSSQCVSAMLEGICKMANANYAIAVSGIAGPTGGSVEKPVGTVYIGIKTPKDIIVNQYLFKGDREEVQNQATSKSIEILKKNI